jgi:hypothetical protein
MKFFGPSNPHVVTSIHGMLSSNSPIFSKHFLRRRTVEGVNRPIRVTYSDKVASPLSELAPLNDSSDSVDYKQSGVNLLVWTDFRGEFRMPSGEKKGVIDERAEEVFGGIQA